MSGGSDRSVNALLSGRRTLEEVLRERWGIAEGVRVTHAELGGGTIEAFAPGGRYARVAFDSGQRFSVHLLDLAVEERREAAQ